MTKTQKRQKSAIHWISIWSKKLQNLVILKVQDLAKRLGKETPSDIDSKIPRKAFKVRRDQKSWRYRK